MLAMEPKNYVGDNFSRITQIYRVTQYNIACCYAAMGSVRPARDCLASIPPHTRLSTLAAHWSTKVRAGTAGQMLAGQWRLFVAQQPACHRACSCTFQIISATLLKPAVAAAGGCGHRGTAGRAAIRL